MRAGNGVVNIICVMVFILTIITGIILFLTNNLEEFEIGFLYALIVGSIVGFLYNNSTFKK